MTVCHPLISTANLLSLGDAQGQGTSGGKIRVVLPDAHSQGSSAGSSWGLGRWAAHPFSASEVCADSSSWEAPMTDSPSQMHLLGPMVRTVLVLTAEPLRLMRK